MTTRNPHVVPHSFSVGKPDRSRLKRHKAAVLWFTGLSGSGKSTLAHQLEKILHQQGVHTYVLDGDNLRSGLNSDLGFSGDDRVENIRRTGEVSRLFVDAGLVVLTALISPFRRDRELVRNILPAGEFIEIYVRCPLEVCEQRDPKGLYKKARRGEISDFTGISSPYEEPREPEIILDTATDSIERCLEKIIHYLNARSIIEDA